jgi:hypothetical protein
MTERCTAAIVGSGRAERRDDTEPAGRAWHSKVKSLRRGEMRRAAPGATERERCFWKAENGIPARQDLIWI